MASSYEKFHGFSSSPPVVLEDGTVKPLEVKVGDTVIFAKYAGSEVTHETKEFMILKEDDVLAVLKEKK